MELETHSIAIVYVHVLWYEKLTTHLARACGDKRNALRILHARVLYSLSRITDELVLRYAFPGNDVVISRMLSG